MSPSSTVSPIGEGLEGKSFSFKLTVDGETYTDSSTADDGTITIKAGETWTSQKITWTGDAPSYSVSEINLPEGTKLIGITNESGTLTENETVNVTAINGPNTTYEEATLTVKKVLDDNVSSDTKFTITIKVGDETFVKELAAGQSWSETFTWETGTAAPTYEVTETDIPDGWELVSIDPSSGTLSADSNITVTVTNKGEKHTGAISVTKETITDDKEGVDTGESTATFDFVITISGTFETSDGESYVNGTKKYTTTLSKGQTYTTPTITWYGDEAPSYTVAEDTTNMPDGWKQVNITNESGYLEDGKTIASVCTNYYEIKVVYDLTMEMSGIVWEDAPLNEEDKNTDDSVANGRYDAGYESGIENIEVYIWRCVYDASGNELTQYRRLATGYSEDGDYEIDFPIYTDSNGLWEAPRMSVPGLSDEEKNAGATSADYYVEFVYDGQTYEPTDFLVTGTVSEFKSATNSGKSAYLYDSMAVENEAERKAFDESFETITGYTAIDDDGETDGVAIGTDGSTKDLLYYSTDSTETVDGNTRKISELQTTDSEGYVYDQYKISATTKEGGLTYPFDDKVHLESMKKTLDKIENCLVITYTYSATYPYMLNINLGLVKRDEAELAVTKDVYSAAVVVNEKLVNYQYNEYIDFESEEYSDYLNLQLKVADANISYKLDLYESDYYYRAKVYEGTAAGDALTEYYTSLGQSIDEMDLDVYLTYKVSIYNNSDSYLASIGTLVDYFDEDLELVTVAESKYLQEANGQTVDNTMTVAEPMYVVKGNDTTYVSLLNESTMYNTLYSSSDVDSQTSDSSSMTVSDNVQEETSKNYYRAEIDLSNCEKLAVGEKYEVYLTFKVRTDETPASFGDSADSAAASYVRLGTKANVAEIGSYTTYYTDGTTIAGKVDKDSAPNNVDIENKNTTDWYEDDSDPAPIITLDLYTESRNVSGLAWEDKETETIEYDEVVGNGIYDDGEELIGNLTTAMVEKVRVKQTDATTGEVTYEEYDFVWPTDTTYDFLDNNTLYDITGYDSITLTSNSTEDKGTYTFSNVPAGNYVVRFYYGQYGANSLDDEGNLSSLDYSKEAETGYDAPAVYNGQDYKTTTYQANITNDDGTSDYVSDTGYILDSEWYDFSTCEYDEDGNIVTHNSDAIDNEARRLEVIAYSETLDNTITNVLATANDADADHTELYDNTYMFADTAKINLNIENMTSLEGQRITVTNADTGDSIEVYAGSTVTRADLLTTNSVYGKSDINGDKGTVTKIDYTYNIEAVDIGLEARSETVLTLDKEISSITLTTNSGDTILKAVYDIDYEFTIEADTGTSTYKAIVELNEDKSYGTSNLIAINKDETTGVQNFRYIYYDDSIAEGLNIEIVYQFTALNLSEVDRTGLIANMTTDEILDMADELKDQTYVKNSEGILEKVNHKYIGEYVGSIYYLGQREAYAQDDAIVETTVRQLIDYVDNDAVFTASDNTSLNSSWKSTTAQELLDGNVIDQDITEDVDGVKNIVDDKGVVYTTEERNNLILSLDTADGADYANPSLVIATYPYTASSENSNITATSCVASMNLTISRTIDSEIDDDDLSYDNVAEIVKFENTVGRRDITTIAGNLDPKGSSTGTNDGEFAAALEERDSSATELITFTPPTGLGTDTTLTIQILIVALAALVILVGGVIGIKKFVINKD